MSRVELHEEIAEALSVPVGAVAAYDDNSHGSLSADDLRTELEDAWAGEWDSLAEYAEQFADDCGMMEPLYRESIGVRWPFDCIDWERAGRELEIGGDVWTAAESSGGVYVFRNI